MLKPMPNPGGRFVPLSNGLFRRVDASGRAWDHPSPQMAYDSARREDGPRTAAEGARYGAQFANRMLGNRRHAFDEVLPDTGGGGGGGNADAVAKLIQWCLDNLTESDRDTLARRLTDDRATEVDRRRPAMDGRRPQRGMSASASASFHEMFPDAARIKY